MNKQILQLMLNEDESIVDFLTVVNNEYKLMRYEIESEKMTSLFESTTSIKKFIVLDKNYYILQDNYVVQIENGHAQKLFNAEQLFEWDYQAFVYIAENTLYYYNVKTAISKELLSAVEAVYMVKNKQIMYQKNGELYVSDNGENTLLPVTMPIDAASISFDKQYIAMFGLENNTRHLFVFDRTQNILQNMTSLLEEIIGYNGPALPIEICDVPQWIETNAFYFLVTANDETRLYYGDLYDTLLPASPEEQYIYQYVAAKSGNWSINALITKELQFKLVQLDITTGNEMEIIY